MSDNPVRELAEILTDTFPAARPRVEHDKTIRELEYMIQRAIEHVIETREKDIAIRRSFDPRNPFGKNP